MESNNNKQHPGIPAGKSYSQEPIQAPASLIPSVLRRLGHAVLPPGTAGDQLAAALHDEDEAVRVAGVQALAELASIDQLTTALHDASWHVRATAVQALGEAGEHTPIEPLLAALHDEDESVRMAALRALANLGERAPVDQLIAALYDPAWSVREVAALTLGTAGDYVPAELLVALANNPDEDTVVREAAQWALQRLQPQVSHSVSASPSTQGPQQSPANQVLHAPSRQAPMLPTNLVRFSRRLLGLVGLDRKEYNRMEPKADNEISQNTEEQIQPLQQPIHPAHKGHFAWRLVQGVLTALLIAGIALSWLAISYSLRTSPGGQSTNATPTAPSHPKQGKVLFTYQAHQQVDYSIWSNDGKFMTFLTESSGNDSADLYVWNAATNKLTRTLSFPHLPAQNWTWQSDGTNFLLLQPGKIEIWNAITGQQVFTLVNHFISLSNNTWSSDSKYITVAVNNSTLQIWDVFTGQKRLTFSTDVPSPYALVWSPDGARIAVQAEHFAGTSQGGIVKVYNSTSGDLISTMHDPNLIAVQWSPSGKYLLSEDHDLTTGAVTDSTWHAGTGSRLATHAPGSKDAYWLCNDQRLYAATTQQNGQQNLDIWDARTGNTIFTLRFTGQWQSSANCKYIVLYDQREIQIVGATATTGRTVLTLHTSAIVENVGPSNIDRYLASANKDHMVQVWDIVTGTVLYMYHVASNAINYIAWSPDDKLIATTSSDNIVQVLQVG